VPSAAAQSLHETLTIGDWHADPLLWQRDLTQRSDRGHVDVPRLIEGNVALQVFTAVTKSPAGQNVHANDTDAFDNITPLAVGQMWPPRTWNSLVERAIYQAEKLHRFEAASDGQLRVIKTVTDLDQLLADRENGQDIVGGVLGIEGAHALEGDLVNLQRFQDAGHRLIGLHHFFDNELGGSLHGFNNQGLTDFGREVVQQIVERNLILDLAHSSRQVVQDVLDMTDIPLVVSHTGLYGACASARNLPDDLMLQIAASGGVIGMGFWKTAICDDSPAGIARSIKAAVDLLGADHVSLGSDFDGSVGTAFDSSQLVILTSALLDAGLTEDQIRKVMGENMLRVVRARLSD
ncbi:MAG: dipeptidase, partial [Octadecabacter sp.]